VRRFPWTWWFPTAWLNLGRETQNQLVSYSPRSFRVAAQSGRAAISDSCRTRSAPERLAIPTPNFGAAAIRRADRGGFSRGILGCGFLPWHSDNQTQRTLNVAPRWRNRLPLCDRAAIQGSQGPCFERNQAFDLPVVRSGRCWTMNGPPHGSAACVTPCATRLFSSIARRSLSSQRFAFIEPLEPMVATTRRANRSTARELPCAILRKTKATMIKRRP